VFLTRTKMDSDTQMDPTAAPAESEETTTEAAPEAPAAEETPAM